MSLIYWGMRIVPVGIFVPNLSMSIVDYHFRLLLLSDCSSDRDSLSLSIGPNSVPTISRAPDCPTIRSLNYMLLCHNCVLKDYGDIARLSSWCYNVNTLFSELKVTYSNILFGKRTRYAQTLPS